MQRTALKSADLDYRRPGALCRRDAETWCLNKNSLYLLEPYYETAPYCETMCFDGHLTYTGGIWTLSYVFPMYLLLWTVTLQLVDCPLPVVAANEGMRHRGDSHRHCFDAFCSANSLHAVDCRDPLRV